jgi:hypothetical protein
LANLVGGRKNNGREEGTKKEAKKERKRERKVDTKYMDCKEISQPKKSTHFLLP